MGKYINCGFSSTPSLITKRLSSSRDWILRQRFWKGNHAEAITKQSGVPGNSHEILRSTNSGTWSCEKAPREYMMYML